MENYNNYLKSVLDKNPHGKGVLQIQNNII